MLKIIPPKTKRTDSSKNFQDVHARVQLAIDNSIFICYNLNVPNVSYMFEVLMRSIYDVSLEELEEFFLSNGYKKFKAKKQNISNLLEFILTSQSLH